jgi:hypothetical protein
MLEKYIQIYDKLNSIYHINNYPYNLNSKLKDNIIDTKKEIELEYIKNFIFVENNNKKNIKGASEVNILIF